MREKMASLIKTCFVVAGAMTCSLIPHAVHADWWQDCAAERELFCQGFPAGAGRIADCIDQHANELTGRCRASRPSAPRSTIQAQVTPYPRATGVAPVSTSSGFKSVYQTNFGSEIDRNLMLQQPAPGSMRIESAACQPVQRALRVSIRQQDDYSRVANGVPRAEISFAGRFVFEAGREYLVRWSTCLPADFRFDTKQPEGIGQIHEGAPQGSPPWGMNLAGDRYQVQLRDGNRVQTRDIGSAAQDRGRWVRWMLHYRPDSSGANAIMELDKDGARILSANGIPNSYPNDNRAYFKIGIYKWWWKERPTDVSERTIFFGDVAVEVK